VEDGGHGLAASGSQIQKERKNERKKGLPELKSIYARYNNWDAERERETWLTAYSNTVRQNV
jgi:hypothetical protein